MGVLDIPAEITEHALAFATPQDVASFAQTCRLARSIVYNDEQHLWRQLYLMTFDYPCRHSVQSSSGSSSEVDTVTTRFNWKNELQRRVRAAQVVRTFADANDEDKEEAVGLLVRMVKDGVPAQKDSNSQDLLWLSEQLQHGDGMSDFLDTVGRGEDEDPLAQLVYQLRAYTGQSPTRGFGSDLASRRTEARCYVYDLRNYREENHWGPYLHNNSGHVNWRHIDAIIAVVSANLDELDEIKRWITVRPPRGLQHARALSAPLTIGGADEDWAGVQGLWRRFVCFMDYRDLFSFNFATAEGGPRSPSFFDDDDFHEAVRLIEVKLRITKIVQTEPESPRPTIHFVGSSRGAHGQQARVKGRVLMTPDGYVRWRFVSASLHDGHMQWMSEGIQLGNVGCAQGVVGTWTGAAHEEGDPAGPFWLWKVSGDVNETSTVDLDQFEL